MQLQTIDFNNVVKDIETYKIVLPDFQREFVWRDENMQKQIVASVFAKMPIGSILLLESSPNEFASKNIGSKKETDHSKLEREVKFLLDGQQRITVLTNVFSNIIFGRLQVQIEQDLSSNYISGIHLIKKSVEQFIRSVVA